MEQAQDQIGMSSREDNLDSAAGLSDVNDDSPHTFANAMAFTRNLFTLGQNPFNLAEIDCRNTAVKTGNRAGDDITTHLIEFFIDRITLGFSNLLDHHLLGGLCRDATQQITQDFRFQILAIQFDRWFTRLAINVGNDFVFFAEMLARGRKDRLFDSLEHDFLVDVLVPVDCINNPENLRTVHVFPFDPSDFRFARLTRWSLTTISFESIYSIFSDFQP